MVEMIEASKREIESMPPVHETSNIEVSRGMTRISDAVSVKAIMKSNTAVSKQLNRCFLAVGSLSKRVLGGVGKIGAAFKGIAKIAGGI